MKPQKLSENEVHIWSSSLLEDKNNINYFYSILSRDEHERIKNFRFSRHQTRFIMARGMLRHLLSNYLEQTPESIEIIYGLWGKPCLPEEKSLHFNVSHSRDYALYAITRRCELGIDLEYIDKNLELETMSLYIFPTEELMEWRRLNLEERVNAFFTRWVSREAILKASGKGWMEDKEKVIFNPNKKSGKVNLNEETTSLHNFDCIPGYASALCVKSALLTPLYYSWNQGDL